MAAPIFPEEILRQILFSIIDRVGKLRFTATCARFRAELQNMTFLEQVKGTHLRDLGGVMCPFAHLHTNVCASSYRPQFVSLSWIELTVEVVEHKACYILFSEGQSRLRKLTIKGSLMYGHGWGIFL